MKNKPVSYKKLFFLTLILLVLMTLAALLFFRRSSYASSLRQAISHSTFNYQNNASYTQRDTTFSIMPDSHADIVFAGDSITARFEWQEYYPNLKVLNRGIDSDSVEGLNNRLPNILSHTPDKIFIMIGINDIKNAIPTETTLKNYQEIIETIQKELPDSEIYVQSILPVNKSTQINNNTVMELNKKIQKLSENENVTYIDLYSKLVSSDNDFTYTIDGVHPTGEGYTIWMEELKPYIP